MRNKAINIKKISRVHLLYLSLMALVMAVLLRLDWPGAVSREIDFILPEWCYYLFEDMVYCVPVIFCLLTAVVKNYIGDGDLSMAQRRLLWILTVVSVFAGLIPLYAINHFARYRLGVPGFLVPYMAVTILFWINIGFSGGLHCRFVFGRFLRLFLVVMTCTLCVRTILYLVKL